MGMLLVRNRRRKQAEQVVKEVKKEQTEKPAPKTKTK